MQYLLNCTAIWLLSLAIFDTLLRKESYHGYNRAFLLITLLAGIFIPLLSWSDGSAMYHTIQMRPVQQVIAARQTIVSAATSPVLSTDQWQTWLLYAYCAGVLAALIALVVEIVKIMRLYATGRRHIEGSCIIIETGKSHSPFSIFHYVFVNSKEQYTGEEWHVLLAHEQLHGLLFHFMDVLILQLVCIVFWFHPLTYLYRRRLLLLHEYQADRINAEQPQQYGHFLIAQALLQAAPSITHSFNRSPIKNRIVMLTRKSSAASRSKILSFLPLALVCLLCFSKNGLSQKFVRNGNTVSYNGNDFELSKSSADTIIMMDPVSGKQNTKVMVKDPVPMKMNGARIYDPSEITSNPNASMGTPANSKAGIDDKSLKEYLLSNLKDELKALPNGNYSIIVKNVVIDKTGKIVYFEYEGISKYVPNGKHDPTSIDKPLQDKIGRKVNNLMEEAPRHSPAYVNGAFVPSLIGNGFVFWNMFEMKDHKVYSM